METVAIMIVICFALLICAGLLTQLEDLEWFQNEKRILMLDNVVQNIIIGSVLFALLSIAWSFIQLVILIFK